MKYLLDTHILFWSMSEESKLSEQTLALINDPENEIFFSTASVWEVVIKHAKNSRSMPVNGPDFVEARDRGLCLLLGMNSIGLLSGLRAVGPIPAACFCAWGEVRVSFMFFLGLCGKVNREGYMKEFPLCDHMRLLLKWS